MALKARALRARLPSGARDDGGVRRVPPRGLRLAYPRGVYRHAAIDWASDPRAVLA